MNKLTTSTPSRIIASFFLVLILFYTTGCKYFKTKIISPKEIPSISDIGSIHKSFFVHNGESVFSIISINVDETALSGALVSPGNYFLVKDRGYRYRSFETGILHEVHIYLEEGAKPLKNGSVIIPFADIKSIHVVEKDKGKTAASYTLGTFGIIMGVVAIFVIIVALTKSSCPYVYSYDGEAFIFEGETFGGAIAPNLERDDYLPLPSLKAEDETLRIRISNELKERQYTDVAELIVVDHDNEHEILLDKSGAPHIIQKIERPLEANSYVGYDLLPTLDMKDELVYFFNDEDYSKNGIVMSFAKPAHVDRGKLVLRGKNTLWFDYQFGEFLSLFGTMYDEYMDLQKGVSSDEREQRSISNDFPLSIYVKKHGTWSLVDYLHTVGPLASRDFIIPINLADLESDNVEIKIETGFMFWELDFAGMDFTDDPEVKITCLKPLQAIGTETRNWTSALSETDQVYMYQENVGDVTEIMFRTLKPEENKKQSYFLHTRGYYELIRDFKGLPDLVELNKFKKNGYFADFSRANYLKVLDRENRLASVKSVE
jgi:hypothetical protein